MESGKEWPLQLMCEGNGFLKLCNPRMNGSWSYGRYTRGFHCALDQADYRVSCFCGLGWMMKVLRAELCGVLWD